MKKYYIGIMSGTSMDGIDLVLASFINGKPEIKAVKETFWPKEIINELHNLCSPSFNEINKVGEISCAISRVFAQGVNELLKEANVNKSEVVAIGSHGQTIRHHPEKGFSMQIGDGSLLAELTNIDVICDFRNADIAVCGEGAPLVPAFHNIVFRDPKKLRFIVNIGGISNISVLDHNNESVIGFDTGPGNTLLDYVTRTNWGEPYDKNSEHARKGIINDILLEKLLEHPYLKRAYPKSTGRETFTWEFVENCLSELKLSLKTEDLLRTLCAYTAKTIADQINIIAKGNEFETLVCGGGCHNPLLMQDLNKYLSNCTTLGSTEIIGANPDYVEALAFAWLALRFTERLPGNLPDVTGAKKPKILGCLYPA